MTPRLPGLAILAAAGMLAAPAFGATIVKERRTTTTKGEGTESQLVESIFEGGNARISYLEGADPMLGEGGYVLMRGKSMYLVQPAQRTYMRFDAAEMRALQEQAQQSQERQQEMQDGGGGKKTLKSFKLETLLDEAGPTMHGFPTRHYKFRLAYKTSQEVSGQMPGTTMDESVERIEEFWATTALVISGPKGLDLGAAGAGEQDAAELAEILQAEESIDSKGFKLKSVQDVKEVASMGGPMSAMARIGSLGMMGGSDKVESRTMTEVLEVREAQVPKGTFDLPAGYTETQMMGPGGDMPDLNQVPRP